MKKAALHNLGCKVNAYETEAMQQMLEEAGYEIVPFSEKADVYVINTCSVTNMADRKSRQMLHRVKKKNDVNHDKWIGVGGKFEEGESPEDCLLREVREETGLTLTEYRFRGLVTFVSNEAPTEYMHLFTAGGYTGTLRDCDEGTLEWVPIGQVENLPLWQGDKIFLELLRREKAFFSLKLRYAGDTLVEAVRDGKPLLLEEDR